MPSLAIAHVQLEVPAEPKNADAPVQDDDEIVVEARLIKRKEAARELANVITPRQDLSDALPRYSSPICIFVYGLNKDYGAALTEKMHKNIADIGLKTGKKGCQPNLVVAFVDDAAKEIEAFKTSKKFSWLFSSLDSFEVKRLTKEKGTSRAWRTTVPGSRFGIELERTRFVKGLATELPGEVYDNPEASSGRLTAATSNLVKSSIVMMEWGGVNDKTVGQLADFATMRALLPVNEITDTDAQTIDSILSIFTTNGGPDALTEFDKAYLKAYYRSNTLTDRRGQTLNAVSNLFVKQLAKIESDSE
jgi:hypothetical protein